MKDQATILVQDWASALRVNKELLLKTPKKQATVRAHKCLLRVVESTFCLVWAGWNRVATLKEQY